MVGLGEQSKDDLLIGLYTICGLISHRLCYL